MRNAEIVKRVKVNKFIVVTYGRVDLAKVIFRLSFINEDITFRKSLMFLLNLCCSLLHFFRFIFICIYAFVFRFQLCNFLIFEVSVY